MHTTAVQDDEVETIAEDEEEEEGGSDGEGAPSPGQLDALCLADPPLRLPLLDLIDRPLLPPPAPLLCR